MGESYNIPFHQWMICWIVHGLLPYLHSIQHALPPWKQLFYCVAQTNFPIQHPGIFGMIKKWNRRHDRTAGQFSPCCWYSWGIGIRYAVQVAAVSCRNTKDSQMMSPLCCTVPRSGTQDVRYIVGMKFLLVLLAGLLRTNERRRLPHTPLFSTCFSDEIETIYTGHRQRYGDGGRWNRPGR